MPKPGVLGQVGNACLEFILVSRYLGSHLTAVEDDNKKPIDLCAADCTSIRQLGNACGYGGKAQVPSH